MAGTNDGIPRRRLLGAGLAAGAGLMAGRSAMAATAEGTDDALGVDEIIRLLDLQPNATCGFELPEFPEFPLYTGNPNWALPVVGAYYRFRDSLSRTMAGMGG